MATYWVLYTFVAATTILCCFQDGDILRTLRGFMLPALVVVLAVFSGLRALEVDADSLNYLYWFQEVAASSDTDFSALKDPSFFIIAYLINALGLGVSFLFLSYAAIALICKYRVARLLPNAEYAQFFLYLYFCRFYFVHDMTQIRAGTAIGLASLAVMLLLEGRLFWCIAIFLAAVSFHVSVALLVPFVILIWFRYDFSSRLPLLVAAILAYAFYVFSELVFSSLGLSDIVRLASYLNGSYGVEEISLLSFYFVIKLSLVFWIVVFRWRTLEYFERLVVFLVSTGLCFQVAFVSNDAFALRSAEVFSVFDLVLFILPLPTLTKYYRIGYVAGLVLIGSGFFISSLKIMNPYHMAF